MRFIEQKESFESKVQEVSTMFLDFDNTLVDYDYSKIIALQKLFSKHNLQSKLFEEFVTEFTQINNLLWPQLEQGSMTIEDVRYKRFLHMKNLFSLDQSPLELDTTFLDFFVEATEINPKTLENLQTIKNWGLNIFILTNGIKTIQKKRISKTGLHKVINGVLTSEDVGKAKPNPLMFTRAMSILKVDPTSCMMIGDSLHSDILGAINAKIISCHLDKDFAKNDLEYPNFAPNAVWSDFNDFSKYFISMKSKSKS